MQAFWRRVLSIVAAFGACSSSAELTVSLNWASSEGRVTIPFYIKLQGTYYKTASRADFGSLQTAIIPANTCVYSCSTCYTASYLSSGSCACATSTDLVPPSCATSGEPSGSYSGSNGRTYSSCAADTVPISLQDTNLTLSSTVINYLTSQSACYGEAPSKIGFNAVAAFPIAIFSGLGLTTRVMKLSVSTLKLTFGATIPSSYQAKTSFTQSSSGGGRYVTITAVNGVTLATSETAAIDTGNGAFFSYASSTYDSTVTDSALKGALTSGSTTSVSFPLSITFDGGDTVTWTSAPVDPGGSTTSASAYDHNVLALGFLSSLDITFDDTNYVVYMTTATTAAPTNKPTRAPTTAPTKKPTQTPTAAPTRAPTQAPTKKTTTKADGDVAMSVTMSPVAPVSTSGGPAVRSGDHGLWLLSFVGIVAAALGR